MELVLRVFEPTVDGQSDCARNVRPSVPVEAGTIDDSQLRIVLPFPKPVRLGQQFRACVAFSSRHASLLLPQRGLDGQLMPILRSYAWSWDAAALPHRRMGARSDQGG